MRHCLHLARKGEGHVAPNPLVGCVIVCKGEIIGEGYHEQFGGPHAEVNAIRSVKNPELLKESTLYVNLEPCAHFGKTPPCADLIVEKKIPYVVVGCLDPNPLVKGKGIEKLVRAGIDVKVGVLEKEAYTLNRRFMIAHEFQRPFITLKWAQSADGYIDHDRSIHGNLPAQISGEEARKWVHHLRATHQGIMIGTATALLDNPKLTVRHTEGKNPLRIVFDRQNRLQDDLHLLDGTVPTLIFTSEQKENRPNVEFVLLDFSGDVLKAALTFLYKKNIHSVLVEGGAQLLTDFIRKGYWDDAQVFVAGNKHFGGGVLAPVLKTEPFEVGDTGSETVLYYRKG